jgi:hypothetical protein
LPALVSYSPATSNVTASRHFLVMSILSESSAASKPLPPQWGVRPHADFRQMAAV